MHPRWLTGFWIGTALFSAAAHAAPEEPVERVNILANASFEELGDQGYPTGWYSNANKKSGYVVNIDRDIRTEGDNSVHLASQGDPSAPFAIVAQRFDARDYRGRRLQLTASVKTGEPLSYHTGLWFRVQRADGTIGFFNNMQDRPISSPEWSEYSITGLVDPSAVTIIVGVLISGAGEAWLDDVRLEDIGEASLEEIAKSRARLPRLELAEGDTAPSALSERGVQNLAAFARLYGLVRWFHPSDEAYVADWDAIAISAIPMVEAAQNPDELAEALRAVFEPLAPSFEIGTQAFSEPEQPNPIAARTVKWLHQGLGGSGPSYRSQRIAVDTVEAVDTRLERLPGGVFIRLPLYAVGSSDSSRLYAEAPDYTFKGKPRGWSPSGQDRTTRLAAFVTAWSLLSHFYPYWDVVEAEWDAELTRGLEQAALAPDDTAFEDVLARMVAAIDDGHGAVRYPTQNRSLLAVDWAVLDGENEISSVDESVSGIEVGAIVTAINGVAADQVIANEIELKSGSEQFKKFTATQAIRHGPLGDFAQLRVRRADGKAGNTEVSGEVPYLKSSIYEMDQRPEPVSEIEPGIWYFDIGRAKQAEIDQAIPQLIAADAIVFDLRGYPNVDKKWMRNLSDKLVRSAKFLRPEFVGPDADARYPIDGSWRLEPTGQTFPKARVFLTDGRAVSFSESVLGTVKANALGVIVGEATAGANGNASQVQLPGGYTMRYTGMLVLNRDDSQHHLVGVLPDVTIAPTQEGVAAGRDEVLEKGLCIVREAAGRDACE